MKEHVLHFIWQHQYFNHNDLQCEDGQLITIIKKGNKNTNEGPDFDLALVKIGNIEWAGTIEIHIRSSDWNLHRHSAHNAYNNVILHVVWDNDTQIINNDGMPIPTLVLKNNVSKELIAKCNSLIENIQPIPCSSQFENVNYLTKIGMLERVLVSRLERKAELVLGLLDQNKGDWEETAYQVLAQNFGFKVNAAPFLRLAQNLPFKMLLKHTEDTLQMEALLFGQAGMLEEESVDEYYWSLKREYQFLSHKYQLSANKLAKNEWKFMRMRPPNFPTIRLSQLASLLVAAKGFFSQIIEQENLGKLKNLFAVQQSEYWQKHYQFGKISARKLNGIGAEAADTLIINTVCVILVAYSIYKSDEEYLEKAMQLLEQLGCEGNAITRQWDELGVHAKNAFDSQAQIELFNEYCTKKQCLNCMIGHELLNRP